MEPTSTPAEPPVNLLESVKSALEEIGAPYRDVVAFEPTSTDLSPYRQGRLESYAPTDSLTRRKDRYVTLHGNKFYSYACGVAPLHNGVYRMTLKPPILRDGLICIDGDLFFVSMKNLQRGVVFPGNKIHLPRRSFTSVELIQAIHNANLARATAAKNFTSPGSTFRKVEPGSFLPEVGGACSTDSSQGTSTGTTGGSGNEFSQGPGQCVRTPVASNSISADFGYSVSPESIELAQELARADLAFKEQIGALLDFEDSEIIVE